MSQSDRCSDEVYTLRMKAGANRPSRKRKKDYHHGNLRAALLESALVLLKEAGLEALSLRAVARRTGVGPSAPYHHFKDRAALVQALAQQFLEALDASSWEAVQGKTTPTEKLHALGVAYVRYAVDHPAEFRLMFRPEIGSPLDFPDPAAAPVFRVLLGVIEEFSGLDKPAQFTAAVSAWSLVHGFAVLVLDGPLHRLANHPQGLEAFAREVVTPLSFESVRPLL
jgi:AcrR family transcriptional regulator